MRGDRLGLKQVALFLSVSEQPGVLQIRRPASHWPCGFLSQDIAKACGLDAWEVGTVIERLPAFVERQLIGEARAALGFGGQ
jgi:hypothetical protein